MLVRSSHHTPQTVGGIQSCTDEVTCTYGYGQCGWYSLGEKEFKTKWELFNAYMSVDMGSDAQANVTALYSSPRICVTRDTHTFTFRYSLQYGDNCHMTSYVSRSDGTNISLWDTSVFVEHEPYSQLPRALVCPQDTEFQIIIQVTKISGSGCGEVRIDEVEYESSTSDTTTCTVTPTTSTPGVQGKTSPVVQSTDTLPSLKSDSVTTNIATVSSLSSESSQTGTTLSSNSAKSSTDLRETEEETAATSALGVQGDISSGTSPAGTVSSSNSILQTSLAYTHEQLSANTLSPQETSSSHSVMFQSLTSDDRGAASEGVQGDISSGTSPAGTVSSSNSTIETYLPYTHEQLSANTLSPQESSSSSHSVMIQSSTSDDRGADSEETSATSALGVQGNISSGTSPAGTVSSSSSTLQTSQTSLPYTHEQLSANTLSPQESSSSSHSVMIQYSTSDDRGAASEVQRGSAAPQDKKMSAGLGVGIGLTVCILFIISASVIVFVVRKKCKTSEKRTVINTYISIHEPADNEKPRNAQETFATDGDMTVHTELLVHQRTTRDDRVTSFDHVITEAGSCPDCSQENYGVLFSKVSEEQATRCFELDTYSHVKAQNATGDVSDGNKTLRISELGQSNLSDDNKAGAPQDTDDNYVELRTSLSTWHS